MMSAGRAASGGSQSQTIRVFLDAPEPVDGWRAVLTRVKAQFAIKV
jgi:hypothetical protein